MSSSDLSENDVFLRKERSFAVSESGNSNGSCDYAQDDNKVFGQSLLPFGSTSQAFEPPVAIHFNFCHYFISHRKLQHEFATFRQ
jgi:hypothetical protein